MPASIKELLQDAQAQLRKNAGDKNTAIEQPRLEAEILLAYALCETRTFLHTWPERTTTQNHADTFQALITRRTNGEPIAHLIGKRDFWDMTLQVSADTLIPRPETETLVELALAKIPTDARWQIADLGTGSGAIALAIARERPLCEITATDISPAALAVAQDNATHLKVRNLHFAEGRWCEPLRDTHFEMIVSNPPYIHPADPHLQQGDLRFEPLGALQSGPDGLSDIRTICTEARRHLRSPGWLLLEHGYDQGSTVPAILCDLGYQQIQTEKDLAQQDRVTLGAWAG